MNKEKESQNKNLGTLSIILGVLSFLLIPLFVMGFFARNDVCYPSIGLLPLATIAIGFLAIYKGDKKGGELGIALGAIASIILTLLQVIH